LKMLRATFCGSSLIFSLFLCAVWCGAAQPSSRATCAPITPGGDLVMTRVLPVAFSRAHELIVDAMQANGLVLYRDMEDTIGGERVPERIKSLRLPNGSEAISATLKSVGAGDTSGTEVRVETLRSSFKKGAPKQSWSTAVLDEASCLLRLLSTDDPMRRPLLPAGGGEEITIPANTPLLVRSRRFFFNTDVKLGQNLPFEAGEAVVINGHTVIPKGAAVRTAIQQISDSKSFGRAAQGELIFKYVVMPDGQRLPLRGIVDLTGKTTHLRGVTAEAATVAITVALVAAGGGGPLGNAALGEPGLGFAVPAGSSATVEFDGDQKVRLQSTSAGPSELVH
jgi:hypothetical protein